MKPMRVAVALAFVLTLAAGAYAGWSIELAKDFPVRGEPVELFVTPPDGEACSSAQVSVTYRPNSKTEKEVVIGSPQAACELTWIPEDPGIVRITVKVNGKTEAEKRASVRFAKTPASGIVILIFAGLVLYGGIAYSFKVSFSREDWK